GTLRWLARWRNFAAFADVVCCYDDTAFHPKRHALGQASCAKGGTRRCRAWSARSQGAAGSLRDERVQETGGHWLSVADRQPQGRWVSSCVLITDGEQ